MRNEADFKTKFCKSVKEDKGFTIKLAAPMMGGIPDIYCIYPGYMPVLLEAKWLGDLTKYFNRKIPYSKLQIHWMQETNKVQKHSSFGLIGFKHQDNIYCVLMDHYVENINHGFKAIHPYCMYYNKRLQVDNMFHTSYIPMMNTQPLQHLTRHVFPGMIEGIINKDGTFEPTGDPTDLKLGT